jgi:2-dehydropantoate 2-reductase
MSERILVYGAGAIGGQVAGRLASAGHDVTAAEPWAAHRDAINRAGISIRALDGSEQTHRLRAVAPEALEGPFDVLILAVKSFDTLAVLERALPLLAPGAPVVSTQNSLNEEWLAPVVGAERVVGGVILVNAVLLEPGRISATASVTQASASARLPGVFVGEYQRPAGALARRIAGMLEAVWPAVAIDDLLHERWSKMVNNTMLNPTSGVSGLRSADLLANADARRALVGIAAEVLLVAQAEGHPLERVMGDFTARQVLDGAANRDGAFERGLAERAERVSQDAATSLLQDVLRGRPTEVDYFSGLIARKGAAHGIATPWCTAVTEMVHRVESGALAPAPENLAALVRNVTSA